MDDDDAEFSLKDWDLRARIGSQNRGSKRFSASHVRTLREEARSFRSNVVISSTASSPGYTLRDEIDPSTYSFTNALKALQAKQGCVNIWDSMSPEGFALNSKWSDAERYICNPLSGEVPMECLSAKTLGQRSFRSMTSRITMSGPLVYPSNYSRHIQPKPPPPASLTAASNNMAQLPIEVKKAMGRTRDVGMQSTPSDIVRSSSPSPTSTPSIDERNVKRSVSEAEDSPNSGSKVISKEEAEEKETGDDEQKIQEINDKIVEGKDELVGGEDENSPNGQVYRCLSWMMVTRKKKKMKKKRQREKKPDTRRKPKLLFLPSKNGC